LESQADPVRLPAADGDARRAGLSGGGVSAWSRRPKTTPPAGPTRAGRRTCSCRRLSSGDRPAATIRIGALVAPHNRIIIIIIIIIDLRLMRLDRAAVADHAVFTNSARLALKQAADRLLHDDFRKPVLRLVSAAEHAMRARATVTSRSVCCPGSRTRCSSRWCASARSPRRSDASASSSSPPSHQHQRLDALVARASAPGGLVRRVRVVLLSVAGLSGERSPSASSCRRKPSRVSAAATTRYRKRPSRRSCNSRCRRRRPGAAAGRRACSVPPWGGRAAACLMSCAPRGPGQATVVTAPRLSRLAAAVLSCRHKYSAPYNYG
jgi:hypothetical protein